MAWQCDGAPMALRPLRSLFPTPTQELRIATSSVFGRSKCAPLLNWGIAKEARSEGLGRGGSQRAETTDVRNRQNCLFVFGNLWDEDLERCVTVHLLFVFGLWS